jgi:hypothetical protein
MRPVNSKEVKNDRLGVLHCRNVLPSGFCTVSIQKIALSVVALALFTTKGMLPMLPLGAGIAIVAPGSAPGGIAVAGAVTLTDAVEMTSTVVWKFPGPVSPPAKEDLDSARTEAGCPVEAADSEMAADREGRAVALADSRLASNWQEQSPGPTVL